MGQPHVDLGTWCELSFGLMDLPFYGLCGLTQSCKLHCMVTLGEYMYIWNSLVSPSLYLGIHGFFTLIPIIMDFRLL